MNTINLINLNDFPKDLSLESGFNSDDDLDDESDDKIFNDDLDDKSDDKSDDKIFNDELYKLLEDDNDNEKKTIIRFPKKIK